MKEATFVSTAKLYLPSSFSTLIQGVAIGEGVVDSIVAITVLYFTKVSDWTQKIPQQYRFARSWWKLEVAEDLPIIAHDMERFIDIGLAILAETNDVRYVRLVQELSDNSPRLSTSQLSLVNPFAVLNVDLNVTLPELRKARQRLALRYHPDMQVSSSGCTMQECEDMIRMINAAYEYAAQVCRLRTSFDLSLSSILMSENVQSRVKMRLSHLRRSGRLEPIAHPAYEILKLALSTAKNHSIYWLAHLVKQKAQVNKLLDAKFPSIKEGLSDDDSIFIDLIDKLRINGKLVYELPSIEILGPSSFVCCFDQIDIDVRQEVDPTIAQFGLSDIIDQNVQTECVDDDYAIKQMCNHFESFSLKLSDQDVYLIRCELIQLNYRKFCDRYDSITGFLSPLYSGSITFLEPKDWYWENFIDMKDVLNIPRYLWQEVEIA